MKQGLNMVARLVFLGLIATLSACSSLKDLSNVNLWPFGKSAEVQRVYQPANSTPYICEGNKKFYVRMLDKGASAWLILPDREVLLTQIGASKVYSNGISRLDLSSDDVVLDVNETTKYVACKSNPIAKVTKVEPAVQQVAVQVEPAKADADKKSDQASLDSSKLQPQETSDKSWFDKLKFWESDHKASTVKANPKPIIVEAAKADEPKIPEPAFVVDVPVKQDMQVVADSQAVAEPAGDRPQAIMSEVTQQPSQEEPVVAKVNAKETSNQAEIFKTLNAWADAWRTKNADVYLSFYSAKFKPEGLSQKAWIEQRKQRVGNNQTEIMLALENIRIVEDGKKAEVSFTQHYSSGKFSDAVVKVLSFENENGHWFIVKEIAQSKK